MSITQLYFFRIDNNCFEDREAQKSKSAKDYLDKISDVDQENAQHLNKETLSN